MSEISLNSLRIASQNGIVSTKQLYVFMTIAKVGAGYLEDLFPECDSHEEYVSIYSTVRKLADGSPTRVNDGLNLLIGYPGNRGRKKIFVPSPKGAILYHSLISGEKEIKLQL